MCTYLPAYFYNGFRCKILLGLFFLVYFLNSQITFGNKIDSLIKQVELAPLKDKAAIYMQLFIQTTHQFDSAVFFANQARNFALQAGDSLNYVRAEYALGFIYKNQGLSNESIPHYLKSLKTARNNNYADREKSSLNGLALAYYNLSQFDNSLKYHFESLALREKEGDFYEIAISVNNIGLVYYQLKDFNKSILYFNRAIDIEEKFKIEGVEGTFVNLGLAYLGLEKFDLALQNFDKALLICREECSSNIYLEALNGSGACLIKLNKLNEAEVKLQLALEVASERQLNLNLITIYHNLAKIDIQKKEYEKALDKINLSQSLALELNLRSWVKNNFKLLAELYYGTNDFKKAYDYQLDYDSINNELFNDEVAKNLVQIQVDFQERENLQIIELQNKEINRRTTLLALAVVISVLTLVIIFILYRNNKIRKRVNKKLSDANQTIEQQNKKLTGLNSELEEKVKERTEALRSSNDALLKANTELDNFIYKTSHDIRGPLATLMGICNIALMDIKEQMAVDYFQKLSKTANKLNQILSKLLIINQINNSLPSQQDINVHDTITELVEIDQINAFHKEIEVDIEVDRKLLIHSDLELIKIILSNLINNAFKFYQTSKSIHSFIKINAFVEDRVFKFVIIDNGMGISESVSGQIFDIFSKTSEIQDTAGLGLYLAKLAADKLNGNIKVDKTPDNNTRFIFSMPLD